MTRRIGNTNYRIRVFLSENATETFEEKVLRLVRNDTSLDYTKSKSEKNTNL